MLDIFYTLNKYITNFIDEWKEIISKKEIKYEINENVPKSTREVNESFFIIYESLLKCIFNNSDKYKQIKDEIFYEFLDSIKKISKVAIQIYYKLYLPSKEIYTLQILINIISTYDSLKNKKNIKNIQEIFIEIINKIINDNTNIIDKNYKGLEDNYIFLQVLLDDLIDKTNNEKEYSLLLNNLFIYRFNKSFDKEYRKKISIIFFSDISDSQLKYILPILKKLLPEVEPKNIIDEEYTEQECLDNFMNNFINVDNDNLELYKIINEKHNDILDLNILYYFECECHLYFEKITKKRKLNEINNNKVNKFMNDILLKLSFKYFQKAMSYYLGLNNFDINANKLGIIYCIAYIKNYLKKLADFITYNKNKNILNFGEIINELLQNNNKKKIFSLKIFLFKSLFINENLNYLEFIESIKNRNDIQQLLRHDEFSNLFSINENKHSYNYSFININSYDYYCNLNKIIDVSIDNFENNKEFSSIANFINKDNYNGFDLFYNILINKFIFDLYGKENDNENLSGNANIIFNKFNQININLHDNSKTIISYLINKNLFFSKILPKLKIKNNNINSDQLYILLLCIKFVISLQYFENNIFSLFYTNKNNKQNLINFLNNNYIPGAYQIQNEFVESYYEIENHLRTQPSSNTIYICSCGKYYNVRQCGFPIIKSKCVKCNLDIGGINHKLVRREGHYRIFLNREAQQKEFSKPLLISIFHINI